jgi:hypothetical protein
VVECHLAIVVDVGGVLKQLTRVREGVLKLFLFVDTLQDLFLNVVHRFVNLVLLCRILIHHLQLFG